MLLCDVMGLKNEDELGIFIRSAKFYFHWQT